MILEINRYRRLLDIVAFSVVVIAMASVGDARKSLWPPVARGALGLCLVLVFMVPGEPRTRGWWRAGARTTCDGRRLSLPLPSPTPAVGVEVEETLQTEDRTGAVVTQAKCGKKRSAVARRNRSPRHFPVLSLRSVPGLFPNDLQGCTMYQWTRQRSWPSAAKRVLASRMRSVPPPAGAADFPHALYPDAVPWMAFLRVLDAPGEGGVGALHQQIKPCTVMWAENVKAKISIR